MEDWSVPGRLFDRSPEGVGLYLPHRLPRGLVTQVSWEGIEPVQAVVRHCRPGESQFVAGLMHLPEQRRLEDREPLDEPGNLVWDDLMHGRRASKVTVHDISNSGLSCRCSHSVPVPLLVCLISGGWQYYGTTRYCAEHEGAHTIGIQIVRAEIASHVA